MHTLLLLLLFAAVTVSVYQFPLDLFHCLTHIRWIMHLNFENGLSSLNSTNSNTYPIIWEVFRNPNKIFDTILMHSHGIRIPVEYVILPFLLLLLLLLNTHIGNRVAPPNAQFQFSDLSSHKQSNRTATKTN